MSPTFRAKIEIVPPYEGMNELAQSFARALFSAFPKWERFAKIVNDDKTGAHWIEVEVVQDGTNRVLHLSTADDEITIGFEQWHTHVGPFLGTDTSESVTTAISIIENFVAERTVVKVIHQDGVWIRSSLDYVVAPSEMEPNSTTRIFSWRRSFDESIETP
jgi:hypothetical protein